MFVKLNKVVNDKDKKPLFQIAKELLISAVTFKCLPSHYFTDLLYRKSEKNYLDYLTSREIVRVHQALHSLDALDILDNKLLFHEHFSHRGLRVPEQLCYNLKDRWFMDASLGIPDVEIRSVGEFLARMAEIFSRSGCHAIFAKPIRGSMGAGIRRITRDMLSLQRAEVQQVFESMRARGHIVQKEVVQNAELKRLNATSLNTIRMDVFLNDEGTPEIISAYLRTGVAGSFVDNVSAGGVYVGIDVGTGRLHEIGRKRIQFGGTECETHPDSGIKFKEFVIPDFSEVKAMACRATQLLQERLVCWDIGIAVDGPVLIEGNGWYGLSAPQIAYGGYRRNSVFLKAMQAAGMKTRKGH